MTDHLESFATAIQDFIQSSKIVIMDMNGRKYGIVADVLPDVEGSQVFVYMQDDPNSVGSIRE